MKAAGEVMLNRALLMVLVCQCFGCQKQYEQPVWDESVLNIERTNVASAAKWSLISSEISGGKVLRTGQASKSGCVSSCEYSAPFANGPVNAMVFKYDTPENALQYYSKMVSLIDMPLGCRGNAFGFQYVITKSMRPRSDPEGGGGYHDRRITKVKLQKNVTVVLADIYTQGACVQVDVAQVVRDVNGLVGTW